MRKSLDLEQEGCYLKTGKNDCLEKCGFNATAKTIFIIHGWTVHMNDNLYLSVNKHLCSLGYFFGFLGHFLDFRVNQA